MGPHDRLPGSSGPLAITDPGILQGPSGSITAEVVEVRVGRHPEFTRVVFELDRAAGYRIERSDPSSDVHELVVSLDVAHRGRGTASCGPDVLAQYRLSVGRYEFAYRVRLLN